MMYLVRGRIRVRDRARARARVRVSARGGAWAGAGARSEVTDRLRVRSVPRYVLDLVEAEPVEEGLVRHRGEGVVPAEHDVLGVDDLVREEGVSG